MSRSEAERERERSEIVEKGGTYPLVVKALVELCRTIDDLNDDLQAAVAVFARDVNAILRAPHAD